MQEDKRMMGHAFRRCSFEIKVKKKKAVFWTTFFLSILEPGSSAVEAVGPGRSQRIIFILKYVLLYHLDSIKSS